MGGRQGAPGRGGKPAALAVATALWEAGRRDDALRKFQEALRHAPNDPSVLIGAARAFGSQYQIQRSKNLLERAARVASRRLDVLQAVGETYLTIGRLAEAESCFRRISRFAEAPQALLELAKICERRHALDEAESLIGRILRAEPRAIPAHLLHAKLQRRRGALQDAETTLRRILGGGAGHPNLVAQAYGDLCDLLDASGQYEAAWEAALQCKRILTQHETAAWEAAQFVLARCEQMVAGLSRERFERWQTSFTSDTGNRLALLTGFPRTGTTLLEQVLDAHPQVVSAEEREVFSGLVFPLLGSGHRADAPIVPLLEGLSTAQLATARQSYLEAMEATLGEPIGDRFFVDKNPAMNLMIPPMRRVFPELRLIVALRDPRDVVVSCFLRYLPINPVSVCFLTLERTVDRYRLDMETWLKMRDMLDGWVEVRYEEIVASVEQAAKRVLGELQLPWDDAMLTYRTRPKQKAVLSPSYEAVARPVFTTSIGRWQNYERQLAPQLAKLTSLAKALGYEA